MSAIAKVAGSSWLSSTTTLQVRVCCLSSHTQHWTSRCLVWRATPEPPSAIIGGGPGRPQSEPLATAHSFARRGFTSCHPCRSHDVSPSSALTSCIEAQEGRAVTNKSAPAKFPLDEIDLLVGWRAGEDEYLFTKAVAMV